MLGNNGKMISRSVTNSSSRLLENVPSIKKLSRHRSKRKKSKILTEPQTSNIIHTSIRKQKSNESNKDSTINPTGNLIKVRYYFRSLYTTKFIIYLYSFHQS